MDPVQRRHGAGIVNVVDPLRGRNRSRSATSLHDAAGLRQSVRLDRLEAAAAAFTARASDFEAARDARHAGGAPADAAALNARLIALEKAFIDMEGLQGRPWSRSLYTSPDPFSGYAASWLLPCVRYEIETGNAAGVGAWEARYVAAVQELERRVIAATVLLR
jgi:hypothetical protein